MSDELNIERLVPCLHRLGTGNRLRVLLAVQLWGNLEKTLQVFFLKQEYTLPHRIFQGKCL